MLLEQDVTYKLTFDCSEQKNLLKKMVLNLLYLNGQAKHDILPGSIDLCK